MSIHPLPTALSQGQHQGLGPSKSFEVPPTPGSSSLIANPWKPHNKSKEGRILGRRSHIWVKNSRKLSGGAGMDAHGHIPASVCAGEAGVHTGSSTGAVLLGTTEKNWERWEPVCRQGSAPGASHLLPGWSRIRSLVGVHRICPCWPTPQAHEFPPQGCRCCHQHGRVSYPLLRKWGDPWTFD